MAVFCTGAVVPKGKRDIVFEVVETVEGALSYEEGYAYALLPDGTKVENETTARVKVGEIIILCVSSSNQTGTVTVNGTQVAATSGSMGETSSTSYRYEVTCNAIISLGLRLLTGSYYGYIEVTEV